MALGCGDEEWRGNFRRDKNQGFQNPNVAQSGEFPCRKGKAVGDNALIQGFVNKEINMRAGVAGNINPRYNIGLGLDELDGL